MILPSAFLFPSGLVVAVRTCPFHPGPVSEHTFLLDPTPRQCRHAAATGGDKVWKRRRWSWMFSKTRKNEIQKKKDGDQEGNDAALVAACTWTGLLDMHLASSPFSLRRPAALHAACTACRAGCDEPLVRTVACAPGGARRSERTKTSAISFLQHAPPDSDPAAFTSSSRRQRRTMQA